MAKELSKDELIQKRVELENETNELQTAAAEATYSVDFENASNLNAVLKQIDKSYRWNIKNAAFVINLYENLKTEKLAIKKSEIKRSYAINVNSINLNTLYQVLTNIDGVGIENAKTFTSILTNVGKQITTAMQEMSANNKVIQEKHVALGELDSKIAELSKETVEADEIS